MSEERAEGGGGIEQRLRIERSGAPSRERQSARLMKGEAWEAFCDSLRAAGREILGEECPSTPEERADGHRYLLGLVLSGIEQAICLNDPAFPQLVRNPDSTAKWGAENADNQYLWARVDPEHRYCISGSRGSAYEILVEVKEGYMQLGDARNFATLDCSQLQLEKDGSFEIELGGEGPSAAGRSWLPLHPDARYVAIRVYFYDWERELPPEFRIVRLGSEGLAPQRLDPASMADALASAGEWITASTSVWNEWVRELRGAHREGELAAARSYVGGADDIHYGNDLFRLAADEAMIIETELPDARYWSFQLGSLWFHSLDFANRQTSLNGNQAHIDSDGKLRIVVAHSDPGVPNWLDTAGRAEGLLQYRWIWTRDNPAPSARVVKHAKISSALPSDTPSISPAQRRESIARRQRHLWLRERWS